MKMAGKPEAVAGDITLTGILPGDRFFEVRVQFFLQSSCKKQRYQENILVLPVVLDTIR